MGMDKTAFLARYSAVFEHSPWVAEAVYDSHDELSNDAETLATCFESMFLASGPSQQLATLAAHPQLACALAAPDELTADSVSEQSGAGLDRCSVAELAEFSRLNAAYTEKFGFPFIIAVKGRTRPDILKNFRERLNNDLQTEYQAALRQTCQIARFRIMDIIND
jgi:2-oxo-4-hydroxy-4-carboxy-5-ureidoimidazoline decarboxylase